MQELAKRAEDHPSITYQAVNRSGEFLSNTPEASVNAVTWGVFPSKEIIQPTIVDMESFMIWKDEAFQLWIDEWRYLYEPGSTSFKLIQNIYENFYLVNVVDNNFVDGDIFSFFP